MFLLLLFVIFHSYNLICLDQFQAQVESFLTQLKSAAESISSTSLPGRLNNSHAMQWRGRDRSLLSPSALDQRTAAFIEASRSITTAPSLQIIEHGSRVATLRASEEKQSPSRIIRASDSQLLRDGDFSESKETDESSRSRKKGEKVTSKALMNPERVARFQLYADPMFPNAETKKKKKKKNGEQTEKSEPSRNLIAVGTAPAEISLERLDPSTRHMIRKSKWLIEDTVKVTKERKKKSSSKKKQSVVDFDDVDSVGSLTLPQIENKGHLREHSVESLYSNSQEASNSLEMSNSASEVISEESLVLHYGSTGGGARTGGGASNEDERDNKNGALFPDIKKMNTIQSEKDSGMFEIKRLSPAKKGTEGE